MIHFNFQMQDFKSEFESKIVQSIYELNPFSGIIAVKAQKNGYE